jgi:serine/threonine-protein kinase
MLVADLAEEGVRDFLEKVARAEQVAFVPLVNPPADRSTHALEVYSPDASDPLRLLADPVGPPTPDGFPLRLRFRDVAGQPAQTETAPRDRRSLRPRNATDHALSARHTADLEGAPRGPVELVGRKIAGGKLHIESLIGSGGVGAVYRARHRELRMPVAVKVLHDSYQSAPDYGRRFHAEALAASRLDHPNITRVLDFGQEPDGLLYLVMEYLDGTVLRTLIDREKQFATDRLVRLALQVCAGLAHAHGKNIVHKDVKPENLVIVQGSDDDGHPMEIVKVCDFGIAQGAVAEVTRRFQGTPEYMSPEQCVSYELDARSDIYSLGIVMYELATGTVPFSDDDVGRLVWSHINQEPPPPSHRARVDPRLERIILRTLTKERDGRYASMRDLRTALIDLLERPPISLSGRYPAAKVPSLAPPSGQKETTPAPPRTLSGRWALPAIDVVHPSEVPTATTAELIADPTAFLRRLVETSDPKGFAELAILLDPAIKQLVRGVHVDALWRLASTLDVLATEGPELPGSRAAIAKALLRVLRDPTTLAPIAHRVLSMADATGERLLVAAGAFGAHALYSARVRQTDDVARARFREVVQVIGATAMPIVRGGLERLLDRLAAAGAAEIAEDLLVAMPVAPDDGVGAVVAGYARTSHPRLVRAAVRVLPALWRERARPIVLGLLDHPDPEVAIAALHGLAELGIPDEHTARRVATMLDRTRPPALRVAAVRALTQARGDVRAPCAMSFEGRLRELGVPGPEEGDVAIALARGLVALDPEAEPRVAEIARGWPAAVRARMLPSRPSNA